MLWLSMLRRFHSSCHPLPPPLEASDGSLSAWTAVPITKKRLNLTTYVPAKPGATAVDALVIGDSYADDIDMGYSCWPSILGRMRGWSVLNAARGGSIAGQAISQYERAVEFAEAEHLQVGVSTLCIVHLGGNNLLHALWLGPVAIALLLIDVLFIGLGLVGVTERLGSLPRFSFASVLARWILRDLGCLVRFLAGKGHRRVLVSGLPLCAEVPTMRVVVGLFVWPLGLPSLVLRGNLQLCSDAISAISTEFAALAQAAIAAHLRAEAGGAGVELLFFDEAAAMMQVCDDSRRQRRRAFKDGHHPNAGAHVEIAAHANRLFDTQMSSS